MPPPGRAADDRPLDLSRQRARPAEADLTQLGQKESAPAAIQPPYLDSLRESKSYRAAFALQRRLPRQPGPATLPGKVEVGQDLLRYLGREIRDPVHLPAKLGELPTLTHLGGCMGLVGAWGHHRRWSRARFQRYRAVPVHCVNLAACSVVGYRRARYPRFTVHQDTWSMGAATRKSEPADTALSPPRPLGLRDQVPAWGAADRAPRCLGEDLPVSLWGLRGRTTGVQRRGQPCPSAGHLSAQSGAGQAGQLAEGCLLAALAARLPRAGTALLAGSPVVGELFRRISRRRSTQRAQPVHRATAASSRRRFTTGLKAAHCAAISVAHAQARGESRGQAAVVLLRTPGSSGTFTLEG